MNTALTEYYHNKGKYPLKLIEDMEKIVKK